MLFNPALPSYSCIEDSADATRACALVVADGTHRVSLLRIGRKAAVALFW